MHSYFCFRVNGLESVHRSHQREQEVLRDRLTSSASNIERLEGAVTGLAARYRFFQEMRGYVQDLVDCLTEKVC